MNDRTLHIGELRHVVDFVRASNPGDKVAGMKLEHLAIARVGITGNACVFIIGRASGEVLRDIRIGWHQASLGAHLYRHISNGQSFINTKRCDSFAYILDTL